MIMPSPRHYDPGDTLGHTFRRRSPPQAGEATRLVHAIRPIAPSTPPVTLTPPPARTSLTQ